MNKKDHSKFLNKGHVKILDSSIKTGLVGTYYKDRVLPQQSDLIDSAQNKILKNSIANRAIANVSDILESKNSMEEVVLGSTSCDENYSRMYRLLVT